MERIHHKRARAGVYSSGVRMALAALVAAVVVAGCGSSSSSSSSSSTKSSSTKATLTKEQFVTQANAICKTSNTKTQAASAKLGNNPTQAQAVGVIKTELIPDIQTAVTGVRGLAAQTGDKAKLTSMMDLAQADLNKIKANPLGIVNNGKSSPFHDFAAQAHAYGLTECAPQG